MGYEDRNTRCFTTKGKRWRGRQHRHITDACNSGVAVAREYLSSKYSYNFLASKYDLPGGKTVNGFVRWYRKNYGDAANEPPGQALCLPDKVNDKQLSKQLKEANLKIVGLEMLIETAREELGIDIVKKPGTKQL